MLREIDCTKVRWKTSAKARENLVAGRLKHHYSRAHHVYYCTLCKFFHVGRKRPGAWGPLLGERFNESTDFVQGDSVL